jgi:hypothetical protein
MKEPRRCDIVVAMTTPNEEQKEPFFEAAEAARMPWMLGFFDVLGFSARIAHDGVDKVYADYQELITRVLAQEAMTCIGAIRWQNEALRVPAVFSVEVRYAYFSDTIMLWLPLHPTFAGPFLQRCADLICEALRMGIPLRGSIALGEGFMHKRSGMYLGQHVVDAAKLEAAQNWIGVGMAPSACWPKFLAEVSPTQIIEYEVPVKDGSDSLRSPIALDWPRRWRATQSNSLQDRLRSLSPGDRHGIYYLNALAFADWSERYQDWYKPTEEEGPFKHLRMRPEREVYGERD